METCVNSGVHMTGTYSAAAARECASCPSGKHSPYRGTVTRDSKIQVGSRVMLQVGYDEFGDASSGPLQPGEVGTVIRIGDDRVSNDSNKKLASASLIVIVSATCELLKITHGHDGFGTGHFSRSLFTLLLVSYFQSGSSTRCVPPTTQRGGTKREQSH